MATPKKPWPRGAEWARQDAISLLTEAASALKEGDYLTVSDCIYRARELLIAVGNVSADADPLEDPTLREYIEGVVEERVEQILKEREENDEQPGP